MARITPGQPDESNYGRTGRVNGNGPENAARPRPKPEPSPAPSPAPVPNPFAPQSGSGSTPSEHPGPLHRLRRAGLALLVGLGVTLAQLAGVVALAPGHGGLSSLGERYDALFQHDSFWFENIMVRGYVSTIPPAPKKSFEISNVAFFPAYPLLAGWLVEEGHFDTRQALLLAAQLCAWVFWSYAAALLMRWRVPWPVAAAALALIAAHPAAFYLVAGYSESLFLATLLGFLFWSSRAGTASAILAAAHGFGMTATRIVGIPCAAAAGSGETGPRPHLRPRRLERRFWIAFVSILGALLFFALCQARFGSWDFYMQTQEAGWGVVPRYLEPLRWSHYAWFLPDWTRPAQVSRFSLVAMFWTAAALLLAEAAAAFRARGRGTGLRVRLPFYFCAAVIFYVSAAGVASVGFQSMIRYQFCSHALVALAAAHLLAKAPVRSAAARGALWAVAALIAAAGWWLQAYYATVFTRGGWFA